VTVTVSVSTTLRIVPPFGMTVIIDDPAIQQPRQKQQQQQQQRKTTTYANLVMLDDKTPSSKEYYYEEKRGYDNDADSTVDHDHDATIGLGLPFRIEDITSVQCGQIKCLVQIRSSSSSRTAYNATIIEKHYGKNDDVDDQDDDGNGNDQKSTPKPKRKSIVNNFDRGYLIARIHFGKHYYHDDKDGKHRGNSSTTGTATTRRFLDPRVRRWPAHLPYKILHKFNQTFTFEQEMHSNAAAAVAASAAAAVSTINNDTTTALYNTQTKPLLDGQPELVHVVIASSSSNSSNDNDDGTQRSHHHQQKQQHENRNQRSTAAETSRRRTISLRQLEELTDVMKRHATYIPRYRPRRGCKEIVDVTQLAVKKRKRGVGTIVDATVVSPCKDDHRDDHAEEESSSRIDTYTIQQQQFQGIELDSVFKGIPLDLIVPLVIQPVHVVRRPNLQIKYTRWTTNFISLQKDFFRHVLLFGGSSNMQNEESAASSSMSSSSSSTSTRTSPNPSSNNNQLGKVKKEAVGNMFITNLKTSMDHLTVMLRKYPCLYDDLQFILDVYGYIHHIDLDRCSSIRSKPPPSLHTQDDINKFLDEFYDQMTREVHDFFSS